MNVPAKPIEKTTARSTGEWREIVEDFERKGVAAFRRSKRCARPRIAGPKLKFPKVARHPIIVHPRPLKGSSGDRRCRRTSSAQGRLRRRRAAARLVPPRTLRQQVGKAGRDPSRPEGFPGPAGAGGSGEARGAGFRIRQAQEEAREEEL